MVTITVIRWQAAQTVTQLANALMSHTDLDASEAAALAREVLSSVPYEVRAEASELSIGIAAALRQCGAEVVVDGDASR